MYCCHWLLLFFSLFILNRFTKFIMLCNIVIVLKLIFKLYFAFYVIFFGRINTFCDLVAQEWELLRALDWRKWTLCYSGSYWIGFRIKFYVKQWIYGDWKHYLTYRFLGTLRALGTLGIGCVELHLETELLYIVEVLVQSVRLHNCTTSAHRRVGGWGGPEYCSASLLAWLPTWYSAVVLMCHSLFFFFF